MPAGPTWPHFKKLLIIVLAFGLLCRVSQYAAQTSLTHDEAYIALNIVQKNYQELLGKLDWREASPPGFLVVEKFIVSWLGQSEYVFRFIPLLAGLGGMVWFTRLALQTGGRGLNVLWAVLLMGASAKLIVQSNQVKHFTLDVIFSVGLSSMALKARDSPQPVRWLLAWGMLSAIGLWFSYASFFVFGGTSILLLPSVLRVWRKSDGLAYIAANLLVLASLALMWPSAQAQLNAPMLEFWTKAFPDMSGVGALVYWLARALLGFFNYFWQPFGIVLVLLTALGAAHWWKTNRRFHLLCLWLPVCLAFIASFLHRWPFGGNQHMVFAAPAVLLLAGEGMERVRQRLAEKLIWAPWAFVALVLLPGILDAAYRIVFPRHQLETRPVVEFVTQRLSAGDQLLVMLDPAVVEFYAGRPLQSLQSQAQPSGKVWYLGPRPDFNGFTSREQQILSDLRSQRPLLEAKEEDGAAAYLFGPEHPRRKSLSD